jgi:hypothetical protein
VVAVDASAAEYIATLIVDGAVDDKDETVETVTAFLQDASPQVSTFPSFVALEYSTEHTFFNLFAC